MMKRCMLSVRSSGLLVAVMMAAGFNLLAMAQPTAADSQENDGKLRIIAFGAHPDDCEFKLGGTAAKWAALGHHVKFVSVTNGDIGHWRMAGGPLAQRRTAEVQEAARILGIATEVLDIHDGELMPTLENRQKITRLIREWKADLVFSPRTNDYHPDHLTKWYGEEQGPAVKYAEAFEICEYGRRPSLEQIRELFPFFPKSESPTRK